MISPPARKTQLSMQDSDSASGSYSKLVSRSGSDSALDDELKLCSNLQQTCYKHDRAEGFVDSMLI